MHLFALATAFWFVFVRNLHLFPTSILCVVLYFDSRSQPTENDCKHLFTPNKENIRETDVLVFAPGQSV